MTRHRASERARTAFKAFNRFMILLWRLGLGSWVNFWPAVGGRIMVLVHVGRKTGLARRTPLNYAEIDGVIYCTAGFGAISDWHKNILAHDEVEIWLPDGWWSGVAADVSDSPSRGPLLREVLVQSGFAAYAAGIRPRTMGDDELAQRTRGYRLVRIERRLARTNPDGPGDLSWVWPFVTLLLLVTLLVR